jgi:ribonuclease D
MNPRLPNKIVDENYQLRELIAHLSPKPIIGIDTEFHSENRYHPKLMLIQISDFEGGNWIVDPLKIRVEPLGRALRDSTIVMHGGREDLRILYRELGFTPAKYFDVQVAVGMLGYDYPLRYSSLIREVLGTDLHQTSTLSDWSKRPLTEEQCEYALDDVRFFPQIFEKLTTRLQEENRIDWVWKACDELMHHILSYRDHSTQWLNWNVSKSLDITAQRILTQILDWREGEARDKNKQANYIFSRHFAVDIARRAPQNLEELKQNRIIPSRVLKRYSSALLECVQKGLKSEETYALSNPQNKDLAKSIRMWNYVFARQNQIHQELLLERQIVLNISEKGLDVLTGWRRDLCRLELQKYLEGKSVIQQTSKGTKIVDITLFQSEP